MGNSEICYKLIFMKKFIVVLTFLFTGFLTAQVADKPEDVSPLLIGEKIQNTKLFDVEGKVIQTDDVLNQKTVLIVYRGGWCPYCNSQLADIQEIESEIVKLGYKIIAVSPDAPEFLKETQIDKKLHYNLYSDSEGLFMKELGIAFKAPEKYGKMLGKYSENKNTEFLPVPTVYVLNKNREIEFLYINPDYKFRLKGDVLMGVLKALN